MGSGAVYRKTVVLLELATKAHHRRSLYIMYRHNLFCPNRFCKVKYAFIVDYRLN